MSRLKKLKLENIKKANELLDKGHIEKYPTPEQVVLKPSNNVTSSSKSFVNKMNNLSILHKKWKSFPMRHNFSREIVTFLIKNIFFDHLCPAVPKPIFLKKKNH